MATNICEHVISTTSSSPWSCRAKQQTLVDDHLKIQIAVILGPSTEMSLVLWMFTTETWIKQKLKRDWLEYKETGRRENKSLSLGRDRLLTPAGKEKNMHRNGKAMEDKINSLVENMELHSRSPFLNIHLC